MGTYTESHTEGRGLFGQTRSALLATLYGRTDQSFYLRQLARSVGRGHGALQRELKHLTDLGLVVRRVQGNQVLYQANAQRPIFSDVQALITKTVGIHDTIRSALARLKPHVKVAFVYGSVARQREQSNSDVDLMVLGSVAFSEVVSALRPAQKILGREVNPTVYSISDFRARLAARNHFLHAVMKDKKVFVVGSQEELAKLAAK